MGLAGCYGRSLVHFTTGGDENVMRRHYAWIYESKWTISSSFLSKEVEPSEE